MEVLEVTTVGLVHTPWSSAKATATLTYELQTTTTDISFILFYTPGNIPESFCNSRVLDAGDH